MPTTDHTPGPLTVMVVEDLADAAESLALLLQMSGHRVTVARTGQAALDLAATDPPDAVVLDLRLPGLDGWEVARRLRDGAGRRRPFVIAVTGCGDEADYRRSSEAGIDLHLLKPADPQQLMAVLDRFARVLGHDGEGMMTGVVAGEKFIDPGPARGR